MFVVAGGTGRLGSRVVALLETHGANVHALSRHADGDLRDIADHVLDGVSDVVSCVTGFPGQSPSSVDRDGNIALIDAATRAGCAVVLVSVLGAAPHSPMELFRMKYAAEEHLRRSGAPWTIVRPDAFEETWVEILEQTAGRRCRPVVFGRGDNPFAWTSVDAVAAEVVRAVLDPELRGLTVDVTGQEPRTLEQLAREVMMAHGWPGDPRHVPRAALHLMALLPGRPGRMARASLAMDVLTTGPTRGPVTLTR
ncbi:MAG: NAD(P)H-binding protein [Nocardioidaceae bacterium]